MSALDAAFRLAGVREVELEINGRRYVIAESPTFPERLYFSPVYVDPSQRGARLARRAFQRLCRKLGVRLPTGDLSRSLSWGAAEKVYAQLVELQKTQPRGNAKPQPYRRRGPPRRQE